jgi:hypothetical protein
VEQGAPVVSDARELGDRLNGADLVVRMHHRDECRVVGQCGAKRVGREDAAFVDRQERGLPPSPCKRLERVEHGLVLDGAGDHMAAAGGLQGLGYASNSQVVSLGPASGEDDLAGVRPEKRGHGRPSLINNRLGPLPEVVHARRVAVFLTKNGCHPVERRGCEGSRGVVVEVDALHLFTTVALRLNTGSETTRQKFRAADILCGLPPSPPASTWACIARAGPSSPAIRRVSSLNRCPLSRDRLGSSWVPKRGKTKW